MSADSAPAGDEFEAVTREPAPGILELGLDDIEETDDRIETLASLFAGFAPVETDALEPVRTPVDAVCCGCQHTRVKWERVVDVRRVGSFRHSCKSCKGIEWNNTVRRLDGIAPPEVHIRRAFLDFADSLDAREEWDPTRSVRNRALRALHGTGGDSEEGSR